VLGARPGSVRAAAAGGAAEGREKGVGCAEEWSEAQRRAARASLTPHTSTAQVCCQDQVSSSNLASIKLGS